MTDPQSQVSAWRRTVRCLGLGRALYLAYYLPRSAARRLARQGFMPTMRAHRGRLQMEKAAALLPTLEFRAGGEQVTLTFLTGKDYWFETVFCAYSFALQTRIRPRLRLQDDGTLRKEHLDVLRRLFSIDVETDSEAAARLDRVLPGARFRTLRTHRLAYPHLRKLTDLHAGRDGHALVLDSDMLFFDEPSEILTWYRRPHGLLCMRDRSDSYGYEKSLLEQVCGATVPPRLNVGVTALQSEAIDWQALEAWTAELLAAAGPSYFLEQALIAMMAANIEHGVLDPDRYIVAPSRRRVLAQEGVLQHYTSESKLPYFDTAWKLLAEAAEGT